MASRAIWMTTLSLTTPPAPPSPRPHFGSTTPDGRASPSSCGQAKVHHPLLQLYCPTGDPDATVALNDAKVEIRIQFKDVTQGIFKDIARNELVLRIQPTEAVYLKLNNKMPGLSTRAIPTELDLTYKRRFTETRIPEAYEALILDALKGDHSNFVRDDELDVAWKVRQGVLWL